MLSLNFLTILLAFPFCTSFEDELNLLFQNYVNKIESASRNPKISEGCSQQLKIYHEGLVQKDLWARKMFDAHAKVPSGVMAGNFYDLGNYDECLSVSTQSLDGKYCLGTIPVSNLSDIVSTASRKILIIPRTILGSNPEYFGFHSGICMPDRCSDKDAAQIYAMDVFDEKYCYSKETQPELTSGGIAAIAVLSVFLAIALLSTTYEVYLHYKNYKPGKEFTVAFSYFQNGRKLITSSKNPNQLLCLNGLRAISMIWIVIGHEYVNGNSAPVFDSSILSNILQDPAHMFIKAFDIAVDTFFVVGGLLTTYTFLNDDHRGVKFNIFYHYIKRYIRLTPILAILILVHATLLKHFGNGPLWNAFDDHLVIPCQKHFWAALLHIQTYVHDKQACVPQSWYVSVDMQLFILSPLILLPLKYKPKWALIGLFVLNVAGILVPFLVAYFEEIYASFYVDQDGAQKYIFSYYEQTYGRFGPYVTGMILGYYIFIHKRGSIKIKLKPMMVLLLWSTCLVGIVSCVYAGHDTLLSYDRWSHSLYIALNRPAWALAVSGIIFLCVSGYGGPINVFLSASIFQFLSKISYSIYLVHYELILLRSYSYKTQLMTNEFHTIFNFWGDFVFSSMIAIVLFLTFESPMITVEKLIFGREQSKTKMKSNLTV